MKGELAGWAGNLDMGCKRKRDVKDNTKVLSWSNWKSCHQLNWGSL